MHCSSFCVFCSVAEEWGVEPSIMLESALECYPSEFESSSDSDHDDDSGQASWSATEALVQQTVATARRRNDQAIRQLVPHMEQRIRKTRMDLTALVHIQDLISDWKNHPAFAASE